MAGISLAGWLEASLRLVLLLSFVACTAARAQEESDGFDEDEAPSVSVSAAREQLKQRLPPGATREQETEFLVRRQQAAFVLGAGRIRLDALRRLVELHRSTSEVEKYWIALWREERRYGNQERAAEMGDEILAYKGWPAWRRPEIAVFMGQGYLDVGQRSRAESMLRRAEALLGEYQRSGEAPRLDREISHVEGLRNSLLRVDTRYTEAENAVRKAVEANEREVARTRDETVSADRLGLYFPALNMRQSLYHQYVRTLSEAGKHVEAEALARESLQKATESNLAGAIIGRTHVNIGRTQLAQRRYKDALETFDRGIASYAKANVGPSSWHMLDARQLKLQALMGAERWQEADTEYASMLSDASDDDVARQRVASATLRALLGAMNGRTDEALRTIDGVIRGRDRIYGRTHPLTIEAKAVRAMTLQMRGAATQAVSAYREVFGAIFSPEISYDETAPKGLRGFYLPLALRAYLALVAQTAAQGGGRTAPDMANDAFVVTDRLRGGRVQQALIDSATRSLVGSQPELHAILRKEQDLRIEQRDGYRDISQQLSEVDDIERKIVAAAKAQQDVADLRQQREAAVKVADELRQRVTAIEAERRALQREIARRFPDYARLVNPQPVRPAEIAKRLAPDEVLVALFSTPTHTYAWGISAKGEPQLFVSATPEGAVDAAVAKLRSALDVGDKPPSARMRFDFETAHGLYRMLMEPMAALVANAKVLNVISSGSLSQIPFAVLVKGSSGPQELENAAWLVKDHAVSHVASASAWVALRDAAGKSAGNRPFIGFGDPLFLPTAPKSGTKEVRITVASGGMLEYATLPPLPETRDEIIAIAKALGVDPGTNAYFGADASRERVLSSDLSDRRVVAFATHGLRAGDLPNLSQPALAMAANGGGDSETLLTLDDVLKLRLQADWVVLSACNTAAADGRSEEAFSGLGRGFFYAGARSLLLTHWAVESISAQALVTTTFQRFARQSGSARAESLRYAQLEMISGKAGAQYRHPFFWAPYALVGDPAR